MSTAPTETSHLAPQGPAASRKKNNRKKRSKAKPAPIETKNGDGSAEAEDLSDEPDTPGLNAAKETDAAHSPVKAESNANGHATASLNGHAAVVPTSASSGGSPAMAPDGAVMSIDGGTTSAKLEAMTQDREALRVEVEQLRKQLEEVRSAHGTSIATTEDATAAAAAAEAAQEASRLRADLEESEAARERAEAQYETLLGRVEKIKATLGDRLKSDKAELEATRARVEELETDKEDLRRAAREREDEVVRLRAECHEQGRELNTLRSRTNLSQQNWLKEKDDMTRQLHHLKKELESTSTAMGEWEVIALEERSLRESLAEKLNESEESATNMRELYERAASERDAQARAVDGLQRALGEIQEARKNELREMVESSEEQLQHLKRRAQEADARAASAEAAKENVLKELERTAPFEKEVKEKNLLIGKLRHEAIVLNDHLTKALKYIKKTKPEEMIDRQIATNHFLQFLALDRSDAKKFQILQVIAGLLNWTDEQREQAGLARPGTSGQNLRLPSSPFHRTPSSPALQTDFFADQSSGSNKESLASLWAEFLERNVEEAGGVPSSRKGSVSSIATAPRPETRGGPN